MNNKRSKIIYLITTIAFSVIMLFSIFLYIFNHELIVEAFRQIGFPAYIVYPLAIAKALGLIAIWTRISTMLKEWAYAGFFFAIVLGFSAHMVAQDGKFIVSLIALVLLVISYIYDEKENAKES